MTTANGPVVPALLAILMLAACDTAPEAGRDDAAPDPAEAADTVPTDSAVRPHAATDPVVAAFVARVDPALFTRWGACPFECCVYREWLAEAPVIVRAEPDSAAEVVATVPTGERFDADTGFVRITSPQIVVVTAPVEAHRHLAGERSAGEPDTLAAGDTLLVLEYLGEGYFMLTRGSDRLSAEQFWPGLDGWQPYGGPRGRTLGTHAAEWWAHVRTAGGAEGWIDAYHSELGNVDACGGP